MRRRQVRAWLRLAETGGAAGLFHLRRALSVAELTGLRDEAVDIRMRIQQLDRSQLGLQELTTELDVDAGRVRRALDEIVANDSFADAIRRMAVAFGPPAGDPARNEALVDEIGRDHPLLFLMPEHVLGPENTTIAIVVGTHEHRSAAIRRQEALSIAWFASLVADALDLALERYGRPSRAELAIAFAGPLVDAKIADRIARAVELYLDGDTDAAGHMIAPRLERIVRGMARTRDGGDDSRRSCFGLGRGLARNPP